MRKLFKSGIKWNSENGTRILCFLAARAPLFSACFTARPPDHRAHVVGIGFAAQLGRAAKMRRLDMSHKFVRGQIC